MTLLAFFRALWPHCPIHGSSTWPWPCASCANLATRVKPLVPSKKPRAKRTVAQRREKLAERKGA